MRILMEGKMKKNCIVVETKEQGIPIGDLFGIFFEDINHAADGGLYGEMVQNRSFEFAPIDHPTYHALTAWEVIGEAEVSIEEKEPVHYNNPHYLHLRVADVALEAGIKNLGYSKGMYICQGKEYTFSCYARCRNNTTHTISVSLRNEKNHVLAEESFSVESNWKKYECMLKPSDTTSTGSLALTVIEAGDLELDFVSLFPKDTYLGRKNGLRQDIAKALEELKPKFMRFPGGCLVHDGSLNENDRDSMYRWKNTLGEIEGRPARRNNWKYNQTLGLGYYEYFLFCEDIGAKPLPILPAGYDPHHKRAVPLDKLEAWIQETLDLIEFANGDITTKWGEIRAKLGHPNSFGLEYIGVGNEEVGEGFRERFPYFVQAIKKKYSEIKVIGSSGPFNAGKEYDLGWKCARESGADIVDEHYYMTPEWFIANMHRYEQFSATAPGVFLGEYAACWNTGKSALTEAAYMTQIQNAVHAVKMVCYAPLLCHKDYENWKPDLIWFDNEKICKSVNYEVQKLFMNHQGDELLAYQFNTDMPDKVIMDYKTRKKGDFYVMGNQAKVRFYDITLVDENSGETRKIADIEAGEDITPILLEKNCPENFSLRFHAKEISGYKGFRLYFGWKDIKNRMCWVIGGWENQDAAIVEEIGGKGSFLTQSQFEIEQNREYEFELRVKDNRIEGWIDGELYQATELTPMAVEPLYITASREKETNDLILKVVNLREEDICAEIQFKDISCGNYVCECYSLSESNCVKSNEFTDVETCVVESTVKHCFLDGNRGIDMCYERRSLHVLRIKKTMESKNGGELV